MQELLIPIFVSILLFAFAFLGYFYKKSLEKIDILKEENNSLKVSKSSTEARLEASKDAIEQLKTNFLEQQKSLEFKLNEIMQTSLDAKLKKFDETTLKSFDFLLSPFKHSLSDFQKKVEESQENSNKKFTELSKEIEFISKAGFAISKEAQNLAEALKGKKQSQGAWGEMILESVLEYSGLLKGVHYEMQESYKDEHNRLKRPDVVIKLPQNRTIIIDSKVSLNDYDDFIRAASEEEKTIFSKKVALAFRNHIDILDSKDYTHYQTGTLQYVFMFVPIEGAFSVAMSHDARLYEYALKKHIAIVTPSTLTVSLRTIYLYWQSEQSNTLAVKLFDEAGKLYDKMALFTDSFKKIGAQIQTVNSSYDGALKQLSEGGGNILGRVENLKKLGAKTTKNLKDSKVEFQDFDENEILCKIEN